jgi:hypothetical protein
MFSLAKIKNKKSLFLSIMLLSTFSKQCYGMEELLKNLGSKENPIHIVTSEQKTNTPPEENSMYYKIGWTLLPIVATTAANYMYNKYNEDPEMTALIKQEKQIELELKNHENYVPMTLLHQKNDAEEKANRNKETNLSLEIKRAQLLGHYQEEMNKFLQCTEKGSSQMERSFCKDMYERHSDLCKSLFPTE